MINTPEGMEILDTSVPGIEKVLTEECLEFIYDLEKNFGHKRKELLKIRAENKKNMMLENYLIFLLKLRK